jgi:hypothetical protein
MRTRLSPPLSPSSRKRKLAWSVLYADATVTVQCVRHAPTPELEYASGHVKVRSGCPGGGGRTGGMGGDGGVKGGGLCGGSCGGGNGGGEGESWTGCGGKGGGIGGVGGAGGALGGTGGGEGATAPESVTTVASMYSSYPPPSPTRYCSDSVSPASAAEPKCSPKRSSIDTDVSSCGARGA